MSGKKDKKIISYKEKRFFVDRFAMKATQKTAGFSSATMDTSSVKNAKINLLKRCAPDAKCTSMDVLMIQKK